MKLLHDAKGALISAHIIDFKTNAPALRAGFATFEDWLMAHYKKQMHAYRELICQAFDLPEQAVKVSLISCPKGVPAKVLTYKQEQLA